MAKAAVCRTSTDVSNDALEVVGRVPVRDASVSHGVFVTALVAVARVAEHQPTGCHNAPALSRPVLKRTGQNHRYRELFVPFFEGTIVGP